MSECQSLGCGRDAHFEVESGAENGPTKLRCKRCVARAINFDSSRLTVLE